MKTLLVLVAGIGWGALANAGDAEQVMTAERALWMAWQHHDLPEIERYVAPEYWFVDDSGPTKALGWAQLRADFAKYDLKEFRLGSMGVRKLGPETLAVVYNARMRGTVEGKPIDRSVAEASVWTRRGGQWRNVFLHEITRPQRDPDVDQ